MENTAFQTLDWVVLIGFILFIIILGLSFSKKAGKDMASFFLGGRNLPWYIVGVSMVATTFAADTPLAVTELVVGKGISGNWLWWNALIGGMLTTFFFARLWRRAGVMTEVELLEMRYSGPAAGFLRGFKAVYLGAFMNILIIGWVNLAMMTILEVFFGLTPAESLKYTAIAMFGVAAYSAASGFLGVAITDFVQFIVAMIGSIILAVIVVNSEQIGGLSGLKELTNTHSPGTLNLLPEISAPNAETVTNTAKVLSISLLSFFAYAGVQWWASWYPGAEPGGGGYVAQRMLSAKDEKHAIYATLFFQVAHYCIRPWPWILVALCAISLYTWDLKIPADAEVTIALNEYRQYEGFSDNFLTAKEEKVQEAAGKFKWTPEQLASFLGWRTQAFEQAKNDPQLYSSLMFTASSRNGFVLTMRQFLPPGLKGLLLAAFFAAFMSTISTQLNWGTSYLVNDGYKRFFKPGESEQHYVMISRMITGALMVAGLAVTTQMESITGVWEFIFQCGAGLGLVLILRWYWWRINAWSEVSATMAPFIGYAVSKFVLNLEFPESFLLTVGFTTVVWLVVTFLTKPTNEDTLKAFYKKVEPQGNWSIFKNESFYAPRQTSGLLVVSWLSATALVYTVLFLVGKLLFAEWKSAAILTGILIFTLSLLLWSVRKTKVFED